MYRYIPYLLSILVLPLGCSNNPVSFTDAGLDSDTSSGVTCTISDVQKPVRVIFMVDNSKSTEQYDASKYYRITAIGNFLEKYSSNPLLTYSFGFFSGSSAWVYDVSSSYFTSSVSQPFGSSSSAQQALNYYDQIAASGSTPYNAAFSALSKILTADAGGTADYSVIFLSDGAPTDLNAPYISSASTLVTQLVTQAKSLGKSLNFSTVFFGPNNETEAQNILSAMATMGGGQYVNSNSSFDIQIDEVLTVTNCSSEAE